MGNSGKKMILRPQSLESGIAAVEHELRNIAIGTADADEAGTSLVQLPKIP